MYINPQKTAWGIFGFVGFFIKCCLEYMLDIYSFAFQLLNAVLSFQLKN